MLKPSKKYLARLLSAVIPIQSLNYSMPVDDVIYPREGASALMLAAIRGSTDMIHLLLRWGADVNFEGSHSPDVQREFYFRFPMM